MPTFITKKYNSAGGAGVDFTTFDQIKAYTSALDLVTNDQEVEIHITGTLVWPSGGSIWTASADSTHRLRLMPDSATGINATARTTFNQGSSGPAIALSRDSAYAAGLGAGVDIYGMRILITGTTTGTRNVFSLQNKNNSMSTDNIFRYNRIYDTSLAPSTNANSALFLSGTAGNRIEFSDNLYVIDSAPNKWVHAGGGPMGIHRNTCVALGAAAGNTSFSEDYYGGAAFRNNVWVGFKHLFSTSVSAANKGNNFTNTAPTSGSLSGGFTVVTGVNALLADDAADFRPKSAGPLIGVANTDAKSTLDILGNNRGVTPDVGAWQLVAAVPLPGGTLTSKTISGNSVTLSGTTTGSPTSATVSLSVVNKPYNSGVAQMNVAVTLGAGTFTVTISNLKQGEYLPTITLTNSGGDANVKNNNIGNVVIATSTGVVTSQSLDGQALTISGTTAGNPTSGSLYVPAAATNPNGAYTSGPTALVLGSGTFTVTVNLTPGNYAPAAVLLTDSNGTSLPLPGAPLAPVSIIGISGNPEAPPPPDGVVPPTEPPPEPPSTPNNLTPDMFVGVFGTVMRFGKN